MAIAVARTGAGPFSAHGFYLLELVADSSYPSGGYYVGDPALFNLQQIHVIAPLCCNGSYTPSWDSAALKVKLLKSNGTSTFVEETNGVNCSAVRIYVLVAGWGGRD